MNEWTNEPANELALPIPWVFALDRNLNLQELSNSLWRIRLRRPASCALCPQRKLASHYQVQGLEFEEDIPTLEHSIYNFDEFYMLLQLLNITNSELCTQPKSPVPPLSPGFRTCLWTTASYTYNPITVLRTNTHPHSLTARLAASVLPPALFFPLALHHPIYTRN